MYMLSKLPLRLRYSVLRKIFKPEIIPEAFFAYYHKLPRNVSVEWFRDEDFIIGKVSADEKSFMTQGENAEDFINMVNESILTVFDIPYAYFDILKQHKSYMPKSAEYRKLKDVSVKKSVIGISKTKESDLELVLNPA